MLICLFVMVGSDVLKSWILKLQQAFMVFRCVVSLHVAVMSKLNITRPVLFCMNFSEQG